MKNTKGRRQKAEGRIRRAEGRRRSSEESTRKNVSRTHCLAEKPCLGFKDLQALQEFPNNEIFGLTQQLRRSAVSVPANVVEGFKKRGKPDKARFFNIAQGSLEETRYYLILVTDLGYLQPNDLLEDVEEVGRLLGAFSRNILVH